MDGSGAGRCRSRHGVIDGRREGRGRRWGPEYYREVAEVTEKARRREVPAARAVADAFGLMSGTAQEHIARARALTASSADDQPEED
jgi:hypothetical protein